MIEVTKELISIAFGIAGTAILFFSQIQANQKSLNDEKRYLLISQLMGYLFLFNSFIYLLPGTLFNISLKVFWPYGIFLVTGAYISLKMVREVEYGAGRKVAVIDIRDEIEKIIVLYIPIVTGFLALIINSDFIIIADIAAWVYFSTLITHRYSS